MDSAAHQPRIWLEFEGSLLHDRLFVGRYCYSHAMPELGAHVHEQAMEICFLAKGMQIYEVGGRRYVMTGNDVYVTFPDEEHSSGGFPQEKAVLYWMQIRFPVGDEPFLVFPEDVARPLVRSLRGIQQRCFRGSQNIQRLFEDVIESTHSYSGAMQVLMVSTKVVELLSEIVRCAHLGAGSDRPDDIDRSLAFIEGNLDQMVTVTELAELAGLSVSRFKAKFRQVVGIPPAEYVLRRKIDRAKVALQDPEQSVTAVAYSLGFSSSQYFATVFKRFTNRRPGECRRAVDG